MQQFDQREFGRLESKVEHIEATLLANTKKLDEIHEYVTKQKGAAATIHLIWVVASAAIASAVAYFKS
jgi:hypothetical protein